VRDEIFVMVGDIVLFSASWRWRGDFIGKLDRPRMNILDLEFEMDHMNKLRGVRDNASSMLTLRAVIIAISNIFPPF